MKSPEPSDKPDRFRGSLRHYHRLAPSNQSGWDDWAQVSSTKSRLVRTFKMIAVIVALLGLGGIIAGLIIELR